MKTKEEQHAYCKAYNHHKKMTVLAHYGGKCACCGETRWEFLTVDHIKGGGVRHRQEVCKNGAGTNRSCGSSRFYRWLIRNNFPKGFRILCANCNQALGSHKYCPHQLEKKDGKKN